MPKYAPRVWLGIRGKKIMESIQKSGVAVRFSPIFLQKSFAEIDKRYEKETGVKALPAETRGRKKKSPGR